MNRLDFPITRRKVLKLACGTVASSFLWGCLGKNSNLQDGSNSKIRVFHNGVVLPVDDKFSEHQAFAIQNNKILAVGSNESVISLAGSEASFIDLQGRTVLPGFIEPHIHFALMAFTGSWMNVGPLEYKTTDQALAAMTEAASKGPSAEWFVARQFDPSLQTGPAMLTTRELDKVSSTRPVFVLNASGHLAYVNSKLLELAGVDRMTPDPSGGEYFRFEDGTPNGAMTQKAYFPILLSNENLRQSFEAGSVESGIKVGDEASASGITTLCDMATGGATGYGEIEAYRKMFASGRMKSRIRAYLYSEVAEAWDRSGVKFGDGDENVRIAGWKVVHDGSNQGLTGRQREPYYKSDTLGVYYVQPEELKQMVKKRAQQGWPLALHGNGDAAIDTILDAVQAAAKEGIDMKALRCRIEHCSILHDEQIERMTKLGVVPSFLINHVYYWGHAMRDDIFGPEKVQLLDRCASVEKAGLKWTMHSDAPVSSLGTLQKIRVAVARDLWKEPGNVLAPQEKVSVEAAIRAVTINAAWQCHSENEIGSLEKGKLADFVILDDDPRKVKPSTISDIGIRETWMDGKPVFRL
ncbi:MAG: amidohydrolase [Planctomycetes bacterium]|nr:amidohydrolase [Planctomycetota bacterium]